MTEVLFATLVWQVVDFLRELRNLRTQASAIVTQASAWVGGIIVTILGAHASVTKGVVLPGFDQTLGALDGWSQVLVGMLVASLGSSLVDIKQAIDAKDSAAKPPLVHNPVPPA